MALIGFADFQSSLKAIFEDVSAPGEGEDVEDVATAKATAFALAVDVFVRTAIVTTSVEGSAGGDSIVDGEGTGGLS